MTKVNCSRTHCEANVKGKCSLDEIHLYEDSLGLHCYQFFEESERAKGFVPSWEAKRKK